MAKTRSKPRAESGAAADAADPARAPDPADATDPTDPTSPANPGRASPDLAREAVIRLHAYRLWERRGRSEGQAIDDWLQAETELAHLGAPGPARLSGPGVEGTR